MSKKGYTPEHESHPDTEGEHISKVNRITKLIRLISIQLGNF